MTRRIVALIAVFALAIALIAGVKWGTIELPHRNDAAVATQTQTAETDDGEAVQTEAEEGTDETETENTGEDTVWYYLHNSECLADDDPSNDFDFGLRPDIENMSTQELYELWREVLWNDPAIGAANLAWFDRLFGTRYLGEFYESCQGDWSRTINLAKERFMADQELYHETLEAFFKYLESSVVKISVVHYTSGITDQMYVNPFTTSGVPDVVVFETDQKDGYFLKMELQIKSSTTGGNPAAGNGGENKGTLAFMVRADCLFQPTNVAELLNIKPQKNPAKTTPAKTTPAKTTPSSSTPSKPVTPVKPVQPVTPVTPVKPVQPVTPVDPVKPVTPSYDKDKTKGTQGELVKPNDNTGPGEDTNTGVGSKTSAAEKPTNTGQSGQSYSDYKADQKEKADINKSQSTGDPATPSYTPPATTTDSSSGKTTTTTTRPTVDNNGSSGTGNGGANTATPKDNEVTYGGGNSIPSSGGATEAPPD